MDSPRTSLISNENGRCAPLSLGFLPLQPNGLPLNSTSKGIRSADLLHLGGTPSALGHFSDLRVARVVRKAALEEKSESTCGIVKQNQPSCCNRPFACESKLSTTKIMKSPFSKKSGSFSCARYAKRGLNPMMTLAKYAPQSAKTVRKKKSSTLVMPGLRIASRGRCFQRRASDYAGPNQRKDAA